MDMSNEVRTFDQLLFTKVAPGGTQYFLLREDGKVVYGYTEVPDAPSKTSFCAVVLDSHGKRGCTIFITKHPLEGGLRSGIRI